MFRKVFRNEDEIGPTEQTFEASVGLLDLDGDLQLEVRLQPLGLHEADQLLGGLPAFEVDPGIPTEIDGFPKLGEAQFCKERYGMIKLSSEIY